MDENYLDSLLNEISLDKEIEHNIEDDLDNQMKRDKEKRQQENTLSQEDAFNLDLMQDVNMLSDDKDMHFSEMQMEELDRLDNLADLDIGDLDFSDIDFNDLDITNLESSGNGDFGDVLKDFEGDLQIADFKEQSEEIPVQPESEAFDTDSFLNSLMPEEEGSYAGEDSFVNQAEESVQETDAQQPFNLQGMVDEFGDLGQNEQSVSPMPQDAGALSPSEEEDLEDLDALLSVLDMEGSAESAEDEGESSNSVADRSNAGILDGAERIEDTDMISAKKRNFMQILFGDPDEDDELSEEELEAIEAKKAEKKAKKQEAKAAKKEEKELKNSQKKKANEEKQRVKIEKKAKKKEEEMANAEPEKKLNRPAVVFIFSLFLGGTAMLYLVMNNFNYTQAVKQAADYFAKQKYHKAYDEIAGVEVKEQDKELEKRIYTVMYVERLYEAYENNTQMGFKEKALDSLLRGVAKYYEHQSEAEELGITADIDYSFNQIRGALLANYGITVEQAVEINGLDNSEYLRQITGYVARFDEKDTDSIGEQSKADEKMPDDEAVSE